MTLIHHLATLGLLVPLFVTGRSNLQSGIKVFFPPVKSFGKTVYGKHLANINTGANIFEKEEEEVSLLTTLVWLMTLLSTLPPLLTLTIIYQKYFHTVGSLVDSSLVVETRQGCLCVCTYACATNNCPSVLGSVICVLHMCMLRFHENHPKNFTFLFLVEN